MAEPGSGTLLLARNPFQNVRLFFYVIRSQQKTTRLWIDRTPVREGRKHSATEHQRAGHCVALSHWRATRSARRLTFTANHNTSSFSRPALREAQNTDLSRMPTRFDTTENALVTSRAHCWLVAFARFQRKFIQTVRVDSILAAGLHAICVLLQVVNIRQLIDSGINYNFMEL